MKVLLFGDFVALNTNKISFSKEIESLIKNADIRVCNFEAPINGIGTPYEREGPRLNQSCDSPGFLECNGFNVIQLANNHMLDYGEVACLATIQSFKSSTTIGAGTYSDAYKPRILDVSGEKVAFLAVTHHEFGVLCTKESSSKVGTAWISNPDFFDIIRAAKETADYVVVLPHAGIELMDAPIPEWRTIYKSFIDCGADAVIGTHPHVPQGWEEYKGKPIFYSLGNFYFDALNIKHPYWEKSLAVELDFRNTHVNYSVYNVCVRNYEISIDNSEEIKIHNKEICELLTNSDKYEKYVKGFILHLWKSYETVMTRGLGNISFRTSFIDLFKSLYCSFFRKPTRTLLQNCIQCESHRWAILRALNYLTTTNK